MDSPRVEFLNGFAMVCLFQSQTIYFITLHLPPVLTHSAYSDTTFSLVITKRKQENMRFILVSNLCKPNFLYVLILPSLANVFYTQAQTLISTPFISHTLYP